MPKPRIPKIIKVLNRARRIYSPGAPPSPEHASGSRAGWTPRCRAHTNARSPFSILDIHKDIQLFTYWGCRVFSLGTNNLALITGLLSEMQAENREVPCSTGVAKRNAEREQSCTRRTDKVIGIVKKIDAQGFGIIDGADGSKVPFILSDVMNHHGLEPGQKVAFSVRRVNDKTFAQNIIVMRDRLNLHSRA